MSGRITKLMNRVLKKYKFPIYQYNTVLRMDCGLQLTTKREEIGKITVTAIVDEFPIKGFSIDQNNEPVPCNNRVCFKYAVRKHKRLIEENIHPDFGSVKERMRYFGVTA